MASTEWEIFQDLSYYDMWAVRDKSDKSFNSPRLFHFNNEQDARQFLSLVKKANVAQNNN
jgi:hypothetical protein